ncbi:MAG: prepilin-type N-terminal cleavage/methylation domain-containing protein [Patescibacteria group bacterium]
METIFNKNKKGFSLIELIIVLAIISILTSIIITGLSSFNRKEALEKDTQVVVDMLRQARSQTLASHNASQYGVYFATSSITLFTGTTYSAVSSSNNVYTFNPQVSISNIGLTSSSTSIVFSRLSGEASHTGTITLLSPATSSPKTVTIYATGLVESN